MQTRKKKKQCTMQVYLVNHNRQFEGWCGKILYMNNPTPAAGSECATQDVHTLQHRPAEGPFR